MSDPLGSPRESAVAPGDLATVHSAQGVLSGLHKGRLWVFLGPAFIAAVAYIDPGNFATNIEAGARFGYRLLWVIAASNLMAMLLQALSAKLGLATGRNLAEVCRDEFPRWAVWPMWLAMEIVAMATDLAEFLGAALGLHLLFGLPLGASGILAGLLTALMLGVQRRGFRTMELLIAGFVGLIGAAYLVEIVLARPDPAGMVRGLIPGFPMQGRAEAAFLAAGILGATVMPHVIFLHSSLTQGRIRTADDAQRKRLHRFQLWDVCLAMPIAGFINAAMLLTAAAAFHFGRGPETASIETAYRGLEMALGPLAKAAFGVALLASGLSSSVVGTMAGQIIMAGFLRRQVPLWLRRAVTMLPALAIIALGVDPTRSLVWSQVVLSFGLPFAVVPLVWFTSRRRLMGPLVNRPAITALASLAAALVITLNLYLISALFF